MTRQAKRTERRKWIAWLAVVALFVHTLVPMGAAWIAPAADDPLAADLHRICTAQGLVTLNDGQQAPDGKTQAGSSTCVFCVVHSLALGTPILVTLAQPSVLVGDAPLASETGQFVAWKPGSVRARGPPAYA